MYRQQIGKINYPDKVLNIYSILLIPNLLKSMFIIIIMGSLNAKAGKEREGEIDGKFGLRTRNERGEKCAEYYTAMSR